MRVRKLETAKPVAEPRKFSAHQIGESVGIKPTWNEVYRPLQTCAIHTYSPSIQSYFQIRLTYRIIRRLATPRG